MSRRLEPLKKRAGDEKAREQRQTTNRESSIAKRGGLEPRRGQTEEKESRRGGDRLTIHGGTTTRKGRINHKRRQRSHRRGGNEAIEEVYRPEEETKDLAEEETKKRMHEEKRKRAEEEKMKRPEEGNVRRRRENPNERCVNVLKKSGSTRSESSLSRSDTKSEDADQLRRLALQRHPLAHHYSKSFIQPHWPVFHTAEKHLLSKKRFNMGLLRWYTDKFSQLVKCIAEEDRHDVHDAAEAVVRVLIELKAHDK
ncbi:hypothetical protein IW261DRAFT_1593993 [Armillaria novae-zelandiae]|uniref:Uncharacterized protein n=1 Tax=Armillaria novae-zelandiae TaxID=153914 RepID=A0AA39UA76_9AGAR|nr:hypothetical protein IW261DRAFT_1593993 [Armillaria novae-zelandiae]